MRIYKEWPNFYYEREPSPNVNSQQFLETAQHIHILDLRIELNFWLTPALKCEPDRGYGSTTAVSNFDTALLKLDINVYRKHSDCRAKHNIKRVRTERTLLT